MSSQPPARARRAGPPVALPARFGKEAAASSFFPAAKAETAAQRATANINGVFFVIPSSKKHDS
jgi:hypothetical protein